MPYQCFKFLILVLIFSFFPSHKEAYAQTVAELQSKISDRNQTILLLNKEIEQVQKQLDTTSTQANTLQNTIKNLDLSKKKIEAQIKLTKNKILSSEDEIRALDSDIGNTEERAYDTKRSIAESLKKAFYASEKTFTEIFVGYSSLAQVSTEIDTLARFQVGAEDSVEKLMAMKNDLVKDKSSVELKKKELLNLQADLIGQTKALDETVAEKNNILKITKNTEASYKQLLATKIAQKEQFEREIFEYESALKIAIDPTQLPASGSNVLSWPLSKVIVTQYFGNTSFSTKNPQIYNGKGHTGIDLGASIGTPVKASASGIVTGVGNTDLIRGCYSYGKWIFVKHNNGLSTLYAHLSSSNVSTGQMVERGQVIGYSGNTGYSTGPHLHFGVYATQGVRITKFENSLNCKGALVPLADPKAYLNPLSYL